LLLRAKLSEPGLCPESSTIEEEWLRAFGLRTLGVHFHDIRDLKDHLIPGMWEIDFGKVGCLG
jgi:hypothetical protein